MKRTLIFIGFLVAIFLYFNKPLLPSFAYNIIVNTGNGTWTVVDCGDSGYGAPCWCSGGGSGCVPRAVPTCRTDASPPSGVPPDPSTQQSCPFGQQPTSQTSYEVCDAGCSEYIRSYGPVCEPIATPTPPLISNPSPIVTPTNSPCREVFVSSPGPGGQQIQIKKLDCSSPAP